MATSILIFEDNNELREGLVQLLKGTEGFEVKGAYEDANDLEENIESANPDVVLMDIEMPGRNGIDATCIIKEKYPHINVMILTIYDGDDNLIEAILAGATGYLLKKTPPVKIIDAISEVHAGGSPMSPAV